MKHNFKNHKEDYSNFLITNKALENTSAAQDVFLNKLDTTWAKDFEDGASRVLTINPVENNPTNKTVDDGLVVYNYNNEWFRSDDFTSHHPNKYHILFAGCSETEGIGGSLDTVWSKMLYESLKKDYDLDGFYSLARAGFGWQKIITNFMIYVEKYGAPTHLFILMPNIDRQFLWLKEKAAWIYIQKFPFSVGEPETSKNINGRATEEDHMKMLIDFTISWKMFEKYCKSIGTRLLWSTWDRGESPNLLFSKQHENFFEIDSDKEFGNFIGHNRPDGKLEVDDLNRRDGHSGKLFHMFWKEKFEEQIKSKGLFSD